MTFQKFLVLKLFLALFNNVQTNIDYRSLNEKKSFSVILNMGYLRVNYYMIRKKQCIQFTKSKTYQKVLTSI